MRCEDSSMSGTTHTGPAGSWGGASRVRAAAAMLMACTPLPTSPFSRRQETPSPIPVHGFGLPVPEPHLPPEGAPAWKFSPWSSRVTHVFATQLGKGRPRGVGEAGAHGVAGVRAAALPITRPPHWPRAESPTRAPAAPGFTLEGADEQHRE